MTAAVAMEPGEALSLLRTALDAVASVDLHRLQVDDALGFAREFEALSRQTSVVQASVDARLAERVVPAQCGYRDDTAMLASLHRLTRTQASARVRLAKLVCGQRSLTGEAVSPVMPHTARQLRDGLITPAHVFVIADALDQLPPGVRAEHEPAAEELLALQAAQLSSRDLAMTARRLVDTLHPDGQCPDETLPRHAGRSATLTVGANGWGLLKARLSPTALAWWQTVLTPLMKSGHELPDVRFDNETVNKTESLDATQADPHGDDPCPDLRSRAEKLHDALEHVARMMAASGSLPSTAGVPTTLMVTVALSDLERRVGWATTHHGGTLTIAEVLRLGVDARVIPVFLDDSGAIVDHGRGRRLASVSQRRALFARDIGCTFPGCTTPAAKSEIHHAPSWVENGQTNIATMTIACGYHQNEAPRQGWVTDIVEGRVWWIPPRHLDPVQTPRRNLHWSTPRRT